jgi:hypothetical protein
LFLPQSYSIPHILVTLTYPASHAYRICQLANGRAGWSAEIWIKDAACPNRNSFIAPSPGERIKQGSKLSADRKGVILSANSKGVKLVCRQQCFASSPGQQPVSAPYTAQKLNTNFCMTLRQINTLYVITVIVLATILQYPTQACLLIFSFMTPCSLVNGQQHCARKYYLHF